MNRKCALGVALVMTFWSVGSASVSASRNETVEVRSTASDVTLDDNRQKRTIDCSGGGVTVNGNENVLTLKGECSYLTVNGNNNVVTVDAVAEITTVGNNNKVTWTKGVDGKRPKISNPGNGNTIKQADK